jgi:hypothetical protein
MSEHVMIRGQRYEVHECITCGVVYTCPATVIEHQRAEGGYHTCSNGHSQGWTKGGSESERIRRERDRLKQDAARLEEERREALATANAQCERADKAEAAARRLRKRASAGTCPCCKRSFSNMAQHMKKQHPAFGEDKPLLKVVL